MSYSVSVSVPCSTANEHHTRWSWISVTWPGLHTTADTENVASVCRVCRV